MQEITGGGPSTTGGGPLHVVAPSSMMPPKNGNVSPKMEGADKGQRGLRWTKHESLILVAAKSKELDKSLDSTARGVDASDVKWVTIFQYCKDRGVERDASQCRKRWHSLYKDYKKIMDYEKLHGVSYWTMTAEQRREQKLASSFEQEVFEVLDNYCKKLPPTSAKVTAETPRAGKDEIDLPVDDDEGRDNAASSEEYGLGDSMDVTGCPKQEEGGSPTKRKKRKRRPDTIEERLLSALESTSRNLQLQLRHDRELRIEEGKGLMTMLDKLLTSVARIADALELRKS